MLTITKLIEEAQLYFRGSVHYHIEEHGKMQVDEVLEEYLTILNLSGNRKLTGILGGILRIGNLKAHPTVTYFI